MTIYVPSNEFAAAIVNFHRYRDSAVGDRTPVNPIIFESPTSTTLKMTLVTDRGVLYSQELVTLEVGGVNPFAVHLDALHPLPFPASPVIHKLGIDQSDGGLLLTCNGASLNVNSSTVAENSSTPDIPQTDAVFALNAKLFADVIKFVLAGVEQREFHRPVLNTIEIFPSDGNVRLSGANGFVLHQVTIATDVSAGWPFMLRFADIKPMLTTIKRLNEPVRVGYCDGKISIGFGNHTLIAPAGDGKFPDLSGIVNRPVSFANETREQLSTLLKPLVSWIKSPYILSYKDGVFSAEGKEGAIEFAGDSSFNFFSSDGARIKKGVEFAVNARYLHNIVSAFPRDMENTITVNYQSRVNALRLTAQHGDVLYSAYVMPMHVR